MSKQKGDSAPKAERPLGICIECGDEKGKQKLATSTECEKHYRARKRREAEKVVKTDDRKSIGLYTDVLSNCYALGLTTTEVAKVRRMMLDHMGKLANYLSEYETFAQRQLREAREQREQPATTVHINGEDPEVKETNNAN